MSADSNWLQVFHDAGFDTLWYAHPGGKEHNRFGARWHAGVWTGPENDLICVRRTVRSANRSQERNEAELLLSPGADTPEEAVRAAVAKKKEIEG